MINSSLILFKKHNTDRESRVRLTLALSLSVNFLYASLKAAAAVYYNSWWFASSAFYYFVLSAEKALLMHRLLLKKSTALDNHKTCRFCGLSMIMLNTAINCMNFLIIRDGRAAVYPAYMIYLAALYTFFNFGSAVHNIIRFRKSYNPVYSAAKSLSMANALVSVFFLQAAMLAEFGDGSRWEHSLNITTSFAVFVTATALAMNMFIKSNKEIRLLKRAKPQ